MESQNGLHTEEITGTGAAYNISMGFYPRFVTVVNITDGTPVYMGFPDKSLPFTSGGTYAVAAGDPITGATSGAKARVQKVVITSGTFAGGDAVGIFVLEPDSIVGTFGSENIFVGTGTNDATVAALVNSGVDIDTEVAGTTGNASISLYAGTTLLPKGITLGSTISVSGKRLKIAAFR